MSASPSPKRSAPASTSAGAKILVTVASLAAVVGGWAALAIQQSIQNAQKSVGVSDDASQLVLDLPPLPTLVPEPTYISVMTLPNLPVSSPLAFSPLSTPLANPPLVTAPPSVENKDGIQKGTSGKAANKPAKDPVAHTSSS
jgi:hypothetical protein